MPFRRVAAILLLLASFAASAQEIPSPTEHERLLRAFAMLDHQSVAKQQKGLQVLGKLHLPEAEQRLIAEFDRFEKGALPIALWLDLFEASAQHGSPALRARLARRDSATVNATDPLVRFRECLEGGDPDNGREIFEKAPEAGCARCHSMNGQGGTIGPELAGLGLRTDRLYILESILQPDASIVLGYTNILLTLKNGEVVNGLLNDETRDDVTLISLVDGARRKINSADIVSREAFPSAMPPIFSQALTKRQIRDLVEFIAVTEPLPTSD
jgi:putative heme-binding domain-containing protein